MEVSTRANILTRRTYNRPLNDEGTIFENWMETVDRVIGHQQWLWSRALTHKILPGMPLRDITEDMNEWVYLNQDQMAELGELRELMLSRKALPSGRTLWLGGTEISKTRESSMFNCSHSILSTVYDIVDLFWLLLQGCGVGVTPRVGSLTGFRSTIPEIDVIRSNRTKDERGKEENEESFYDGIWTISVGDSAEAWAKSIGKLLVGKHKAKKLVLDFSEIRGPGKRLKGYGWLSSGDEAIAKAYPAIAGIMNKRAGSLLRKVDIIEIMNHLGTVLSSRRSAIITFVDYGSDEWEEFTKLKRNCYEEGHKHKQQSNNSLVFNSKPTIFQMSEIFDMMIASGGSEPGLFNLETAKKRAPYTAGANPCITKDSLINTNKGLRYVKDLIDTNYVALVDGDEYISTGFFKTGTKPIYKINTDKGYNIKCTYNHKIQLYDNSWVELKDINIGDKLKLQVGNLKKEYTTEEFDKGWLLGEIVGDGGHNPEKYESYTRFWGEDSRYLYERSVQIVNKYLSAKLGGGNKRNKKSGNITCTSKYITEFASNYIKNYSKDHKKALLNESDSFLKGYISGFFDADGSVQGNLIKGVSIRLNQSDINKLELVQQLLLRFGIVSTIYKNRHSGGERKLPDGNGGYKMYECKPNHDLVIANNSFSLFGKYIGFCTPYKQELYNNIEKSRKRKANKDKKYTIVTEIVDLNKQVDVYDCTVDIIHKYSANGLTLHNCCEILLPSKGFCNLVEVDIGKFEGDSAGLHQAYHIIARANYRQTCVDLNDGILSESWDTNNKFLRLCGVGATGIAMRDDLSQYDITKLRDSAVFAARNMAKELGTEFPKAVTTVKPSGTLGKIMDTSEGIHLPAAKYLFNWVNFSNHDPLVMKLKESNYRWIINPSDSTGTLICLPVRFDNIEFTKKEIIRKDGIKEILEVNDENAITQLERYKKWQQFYCDQNVSNTIYYTPDEKDDIIDWLLYNWDIYVGVSFLFKNDPTVSAKDLGYPYLPQEYVSEKNFYEYFDTLIDIDWDNTESLEEIGDEGCATGACPIK